MASSPGRRRRLDVAPARSWHLLTMQSASPGGRDPGTIDRGRGRADPCRAPPGHLSRARPGQRRFAAYIEWGTRIARDASQPGYAVAPAGPMPRREWGPEGPPGASAPG